jgi:hypothetical protein
MIKKFISMSTAVLLLVTGLAVVVAPAASANATDASLSSLGYLVGSSVTSVPNFNSNTTSYAISTENSQLKFYSNTTVNNRPRARTCNGTVITDDNTACNFVSGSNNTYVVTVTAANLSTTKTYTITITYTPPVAPVITSSSTITVGQVNPAIVIQSSINFACDISFCYTIGLGTTGLAIGAFSGVNTGTLTVQLTGTASAGTLTFKINDLGRPESNILSFVVSGGSTPAPTTPTLTAAEIAAAAAAAAKAAAEAAAIARAAEIATAQTALATVLRGDKAGSLSEYRSANINITTTAALTRLNAEVLKLSAADRADFAKIKAIADKIEFDEAFFNATARPSIATYAANGVTGVTERILTTINAKVLELPAARRLDTVAIKEIVKVESFVDLVANTATRESVTSTRLIEKGLLPADTPYKHSVRSGLAFYPEGSLNTMAKIEAAIKAELVKAGARKAKTAEIRARIAARNK